MLKEDIRNSIKHMIIAGYPAKDIAAQMDVSERTVKNIKRQMRDAGELKAPDAEAKSGATDDITDYSTMLTKKERENAGIIAKQVALYEDPEEGWVYHMTAQQRKIQKSGFWWAQIVYPESAPKNWIDTLKTQCNLRGMQAAVSPLHDKDVWAHDSPECVTDGVQYKQGQLYKAGDPKKSHWHIILKTMTKVSYEEVAALLQDITRGTYPQKLYSLKGAYEYLIHLNETDKYHYEADEIVKYGGFVVEPNEFERKIIAAEINDEIEDNGIVNYYDLVSLHRNQPEYQDVIKRGSNHYYNMTRGLYLKEYKGGKANG